MCVRECMFVMCVCVCVRARLEIIPAIIVPSGSVIVHLYYLLCN